jgi:hypothetical protein
MEKLTQAAAHRVTKSHMGAYPLPEEGMLRAAAGPIKKLIRQDNVPRNIFFLQATDCCYRNRPPYTK